MLGNAGSCPEGWSECPTQYLNTKITFQHQDSLDTGAVRYEIYALVDSIENAVKETFGGSVDLKYIGLVSNAVSYTLTLNGVTGEEVMDLHQIDYFADVSKTFLEYASNGLFGVFEFTVDQPRPASRLLRSLQPGGSTSNIEICGEIRGGYFAGAKSNEFRFALDKAFRVQKALYVALLQKSGARPQESTDSGEFTFFQEISGFYITTESIAINEDVTSKSKKMKVFWTIIFPSIGGFVILVGLVPLVRHRRRSIAKRGECDAYRAEMRLQRESRRREKFARLASSEIQLNIGDISIVDESKRERNAPSVGSTESSTESKRAPKPAQVASDEEQLQAPENIEDGNCRVESSSSTTSDSGDPRPASTKVIGLRSLFRSLCVFTSSQPPNTSERNINSPSLCPTSQDEKSTKAGSNHLPKRNQAPLQDGRPEVPKWQPKEQPDALNMKSLSKHLRGIREPPRRSISTEVSPARQSSTIYSSTTKSNVSVLSSNRSLQGHMRSKDVDDHVLPGQPDKSQYSNSPRNPIRSKSSSGVAGQVAHDSPSSQAARKQLKSTTTKGEHFLGPQKSAKRLVRPASSDSSLRICPEKKATETLRSVTDRLSVSPVGSKQSIGVPTDVRKYNSGPATIGTFLARSDKQNPSRSDRSVKTFAIGLQQFPAIKPSYGKSSSLTGILESSSTSQRDGYSGIKAKLKVSKVVRRYAPRRARSSPNHIAPLGGSVQREFHPDSERLGTEKGAATQLRKSGEASDEIAGDFEQSSRADKRADFGAYTIGKYAGLE
jgi:hypothetical protein